MVKKGQNDSVITPAYWDLMFVCFVLFCFVLFCSCSCSCCYLLCFHLFLFLILLCLFVCLFVLFCLLKQIKPERHFTIMSFYSQIINTHCRRLVVKWSLRIDSQYEAFKRKALVITDVNDKNKIQTPCESLQNGHFRYTNKEDGERNYSFTSII